MSDKLSKLIEKCTSPDLKSEDWGTILDICDLLNSDDSLVQLGVSEVVDISRHQSRKRLSLPLLHSITQNCNKSALAYLSKSEVWPELVANDPEAKAVNSNIINDTENGDPEVINKLKSFNESTSSSGSSSSSQSQSQPQPHTDPVNGGFRVRALYDFTASESNELSFRKGDIIDVLGKIYNEWWRGQLGGNVGIFPANYVEVMHSTYDPQVVPQVPQVSQVNPAYSAHTTAPPQIVVSSEDYILTQLPLVEKLLNILTTASHSPDGFKVLERDDVQNMYNDIVELRPSLVQNIGQMNKEVKDLVSQTQKLRKSRQQYEKLMREASNPNTARSST